MRIAILDADLIGRKRHRFPILACMKLSGYHSVLLMLTDIMKEGTELLVLSDDPARIQTAIKATLRDNAVWLPGVMSRKKQIIPDLEVAFKQ